MKVTHRIGIILTIAASLLFVAGAFAFLPTALGPASDDSAIAQLLFLPIAGLCFIMLVAAWFLTAPRSDFEPAPGEPDLRSRADVWRAQPTLFYVVASTVAIGFVVLVFSIIHSV